jgi:DNA-binding MarR family transcriptional regulator
MASTLDRQAEELYRTFLGLVRQYQFRDREEICCHGISVSQCYALAHIRDAGQAAMSDVAGALHLDLSTITRLADQLEDKGLIKRARAREDRRVNRLSLTRKGRALLDEIEAELVAEYRAVLQGIPASSRRSVLDAIEGLRLAFEARRQCVEEEPRT